MVRPSGRELTAVGATDVAEREGEVSVIDAETAGGLGFGLVALVACVTVVALVRADRDERLGYGLLGVAGIGTVITELYVLAGYEGVALATTFCATMGAVYVQLGSVCPDEYVTLARAFFVVFVTLFAGYALLIFRFAPL